MTWLAWASLAFIAYTYVGYALLLRLWPSGRALPGGGLDGKAEKPADTGACPTISIVLAACNEAAHIGAKLHNLAAMDYPADRVEILVGSDGSTDGTDDIVRAHPSGARLFRYERLGKTGVLNRLVAEATGEILVFMDARQRVAADALRRFAAHFMDPCVGAVGGELALTGADGEETSDGVGVYWRYEKWLRRRESELRLVTGLSGALYALRRELFIPPEDDTILDDVMIPLGAARRGYDLRVDDAVKVYDRVADEDREFHRKVRTLLGNFQMFGRLLRRPRPFPPRLVFSLVSHKVCRALTPPALLGLLVGSVGMPSGPARTLLLAGQGVVYVLGAVGLASRRGPRGRLVSVCSTFCVLNAAAAVALFRYLTGRYRTAWK
jgi:cellulose synthase/poly-beta-1,6-N-acetylglucosamine synthase-like glycosyltransferase